MIHRISLAFVVPLTATLALAQIPPGHAVVAWKSSGMAPVGLKLVDPAGVASNMPGLDPSTVGTGQFDGATAVLVTDDGTVFAGLGFDNRTGAAPVNLGLRRIFWNGSTATDLAFVTLMQVPPGQIWQVADLKERADGSLLVAATQIVLGSNPIGTPAVLTVDRAGSMVTSVPTTGMASGILAAIADFGDRYAVAVEQSFFAHNFALQSLAFDGLSAPFNIVTLVSAGSFGGFDRDLNGDLVFGATFSGSAGATVHHIVHAPAGLRTPVSGGPASIGLADVNPSGLLASFDFAGALSRTDTVLGGTQSWAASVASDPIAISVRDNPSAYGLVLPPALLPMLGSQGGVPAVGNTGFALRMGEPAGLAAFAVVAASFTRAVVATPYGTLLINPATMVTIGSTAIPAGQAAALALPIPANALLRGTHFVFQDVTLVSSPFSAVLSNGFDLTVQ